MMLKKDGVADAKFDRLEQFLDSQPNAMHLEHMDGFFCALIIGPEPVPMSEFLPYIFGSGTPNFESEAQAQEVVAILSEHWKYIADKFHEGSSYYPFLYADQDDKLSGNDWADAFMLGVQLRREAWQELLDDQSDLALLKPVVMLREELADVIAGKGQTIPGDVREELFSQLIGNLQHIYNRHYGAAEEEAEQPAQ